MWRRTSGESAYHRYHYHYHHLVAVLLLCTNINYGYSSSSKIWNYANGGEKVCSGTENGMATQSDRGKLLKDLREMYTNCTKVLGNLEIAGITMDDLKKEGLENMDFFDNIEEVGGYVLVAYTILPRLSFPKLKIIWGDKTFTAPTAAGAQGWAQFSLLVLSSSLDTVDFRSLRAVIEGRIGFSNTTGLCHWKKGRVDWNQVLGPGYEKHRLIGHYASNDTCFGNDFAGTCDRGCGLYCWGRKEEQCQQIYRTNCAAQCRNSMCFNSTDPQYCCSQECAAGCFGPTDKECYGCRAMRDEGVCVDKCPAREVYDSRKMEFVHNPNGKYAWSRECVKQCPSHMFVYKEGCVGRCPEGYFPNEAVCTECEGPCPKRCAVNSWLSSMNLHEFVNCTTIEGKIEIRPDTFIGGKHLIADGRLTEFKGLSVEDLETLSSVEEITHYLFVQSETLTNLKFLRNLKKIGGKKKYKERYAVYVSRSDELRELGLSSLSRVSDGEVYVEDNPDLCYVYTIPWENITATYSNLANNRQPLICEREGRVCDELCENSGGCWGKGPEMCFSCQYFKWNRTCIRQCDTSNNFYSLGKDCKPCHEQCAGCHGPDADDCEDCKKVKLGARCVNECPEGYYEDKERTCQPCHQNCRGCTGPENLVGVDGCERCKYAVIDNNNTKSCLSNQVLLTKSCGSAEPGLENYFFALSSSYLQPYADMECAKCHDQCDRCAGFGTFEGPPVKCQCKSMRLAQRPEDKFGICVPECTSNTYAQGATCYPCHPSCEGCTGPDSTQCIQCRDFTDYLDQAQTKFNCTDECPSSKPFVAERVCNEVNQAELLTRRNKHTQIIAGVLVAGFFLLLIVLCTVLFVWRRRAKALNYMQPPDEIFEMHPEAKPNLAKLRLILETQLKKGKILGYGAFGTVFQGIWYPDEKEGKKTKVLVAIKVLHESNPTAQKEMLDEAGMMASMENQYLAQLIGVCMGPQLMLVTPLFPLGNLLEYVHNNRTKIGSLAMLRWCTQIANGMSYLEEHRLVHRDLAARNVLVQTPYHIRITDFGLAKMLEYGEEELKIFEGKMPIKWLALECIQFKRYTHKSDVWAYGVTVWELLTFGEKPYKDIPLQQIPTLLEKGDRLPQPKVCSLDIYMLLIKCWMVDAHTRPSFVELKEEFSHMMKDPGRYLVIEGDALLRLPSCSSTMERQHHHLLEQLTEEEPDDPVSNTRNSSSPGTPVSPVSPFSPLLRDSVGDIGQHFGEAAAAARVRQGTRSESISSHRYASDPLKKSRRYTNPGKHAVTFDISTDGDNYLVPDSQQVTGTTDSPSAASSAEHHQAAAGPSSAFFSDGYLSSNKYVPVISSGGCEGGLSAEGHSLGMDYYEYLKQAASGGDPTTGVLFGLENKEYMIGRNNNNNQFPVEGDEKKERSSSSSSSIPPKVVTDAETVL